MRTHASDNLAFLLLLLLTVASTIEERICELQGTCRRCSLNRYSFYTCHTSADCFSGEHCTKERFCCPAERSPKDTTKMSRLAANAFAASSLDSRTGEGPLCPDSSGWCKIDADCIFKDEICAEGKCCPSCRQRRAQALGEMANGQRSGDDGVEGGRVLFSRDDEGTIAVTGLYIPQCQWEMQEGRHYRPLQCRHGTNECWCVDGYGRQLHVNHTIHKQNRIDCAEIRRRFEQQGSGEVETRTAKSTDVGGDVGGGEGEVLEVGRYGIRHYESSSQQCEDPLREFKFCGSGCPISCATIRIPRCQQDQCTRGCFCRLPYVLLDGTNPFESRCVLPAECPMLPFTSELNSWNGGFFPALVPHNSQAESQQDHPPEDGDHSSVSLPSPIVPSSSSNLQSPSERCPDPLKNYQTCGSHCPISCDQRTRPTGCDRSCSPGCFCRVPYILREQSIHAPCILPQYCPPPSGSSTTASPYLPPSTPTTPSYSTIPHLTIKNTEEVGNKTDDGKGFKKCREPNKQFLGCASSCPLGCDLLEAQQCSPCVSGCFCKNGYVFENASDWRNSPCVPSSHCPSASSTDISAERTTPTTLPHTAISADGHECPSNPVDRNGRSCNSDFECGFQQGCCPFHSRLLVNETTNPLYRCTCLDSNSVWVECGTNCPDYCGAPPEHTFCPQICRPGCFCASGYVKATKESNSLCIPSTKCPLASTFPTTTHHQFPISSLPPITPVKEESIWSATSAREAEASTEKSQKDTNREDECGNALASAVLYSKSGKRFGRLLVRPDRRQRTTDHRIRITGELDLSSVDSANSTAASYAISLHQFSDTTTGDCKGVGAALALNVLDDDDNTFATKAAASNLELKNKTGRSSFKLSAGNETEVVIRVDYTLQWGDPISPGTNPLIGHSVVLKKNSRDNTIVLACAVLGIVPSC